MWRALLAIALALFGAVIATREIFWNPSESVVRYATRAAAEASGAFARRLLPDFIPAPAVNICVTRSLDTNEVCATFSAPEESAGPLLADLSARGFESVPPQSTSATRCLARDACNFRQLECHRAAHILAGPPESGLRPFVAIDAHDHRLCYWTARAD